MGMTSNGLIRIKDGYIQKLGGCIFVAHTLHGTGANILLPWSTDIGQFLIGIGSSGGLEINPGGGASRDITPAGYPGSRNWSLANWGDWLLAAVYNGGMYYWAPQIPLSTAGPALALSTLPGGGSVPIAVNGVFVAAPQQQAFAWGSTSPTTGAQDPLLIAWCDIADLGSWTATATNQAGTFKLSSGSLVVSATWFGLIGLFWTDLDLWAAQYVNFPLVYGFNRISQNCGLISSQAWATLDRRVAWMGSNDFFEYDGGAVRVIPCPVRDFVFNTLVRNGGTNLVVHADSNSYFNEITWRFERVGGSGFCNAYVKWSPNENNAWDVWADSPSGPATPMWLNAWYDASFVHPPLAIDAAGDILQFEVASNAPIIDYNGLALDSFFVTGWFYIAEGRESVTVERINPDFVWVTRPGTAPNPASTLQLTVYFADELAPVDTAYPVRTYGPFTITPATPYVIVNGSGRLMRLRIDCTTVGTFYRVGKLMAMISADGSV
jgi:hypothetical protein